jgi:4-hydroxy-tetrahydrodipicolinate synthase
MQEGFYLHFKTIAETVDLPVILYDIPGRCGAGMTPETIAKLSEVENIVAVKEATGQMDHASSIANLCDLTILSGDDSMTLPLAAVGGKGVISVVGNIVPADVKAMTDLILSGDLVEARKWHNKLYDLSRGILTLATNPIPIKAAVSILNLASDEMRLPMTNLDDEEKVVLKKTLKEYGLM